MKNLIKILLFLSFLVAPCLCLASSTTTDDFLYLKNEIEKIKDNQSKNYNRLNIIDKEKIPDLDNKLSDYGFEKESINNLINSVAAEQRMANEKENAYDQAINQAKWLIVFFGFILFSVLMTFGFIKNKELSNVKEEISDWKKKKEEEIENELQKIKNTKDQIFGEKGMEKIRNDIKIKIKEEVKEEFITKEIKIIEERIEKNEERIKTLEDGSRDVRKEVFIDEKGLEDANSSVNQSIKEERDMF